MANATPAPPVSVGDFVYTENKLCYVESIKNEWGWNQYTVVDLDNPNTRLEKARHQLEKQDLALFDIDDIVEESSEMNETGGDGQKNPQETSKRFAEVTEDELDTYAINRNSKRTRTQTSWGVSVFQEYLQESKEELNFEQFETQKLANTLRSFYGSLRSKKGQTYSKSAYINIRAAINRHITAPPYNRKINIMHDLEFMAANQVFTGVLRKLREEGKDATKHKSAIAQGDMEKMYSSGVLSDDTPTSLLRKVFVEISLNFGRRGREGLRELTKNSIVFKTDDKNRQYATVAYNEIDKTRQILSPKETEKKQIIYEQEESPLCPIKSLKKYISKLNPKCDALFQRPRSLKDPSREEVWYENKCLGVHTLQKIMKQISEEAELSETYTNHCLRATTSTILGHAGVESRNICSVTGHKNLQSLESYIQTPTMQQRKEMCNILHKFGKEKTNDSETQLAIPDKPCKGNSSLVIPNYTVNLPNRNTGKPSCTISKAPETKDSLFAGAQFLGSTTINVMIQKGSQ